MNLADIINELAQQTSGATAPDAPDWKSDKCKCSHSVKYHIPDPISGVLYCKYTSCRKACKGFMPAKPKNKQTESENV